MTTVQWEKKYLSYEWTIDIIQHIGNIMYNIMYMIWLKQNKMHKIEMIKTL